MLSPEERDKAGIRDSLVRIAFGIESPDDLKADIDQALEASV
jgi:cystathionine beta-lyase/cystathionine gamma-synthase